MFSKNKPKIKVKTVQKDGYSGWIKCSGCEELIHANEIEQQMNCCPKCNYHYRLTTSQRIQLLADSDTFKELFMNIQPADPLGFVDEISYKDRLQKAQKTTHHTEAITVGVCTMHNIPVALGIMDFSFLGGSMGSVVGEKIALLVEYAYENNLPLVIVSASGGARMQESILSLMQMAKTSSALTLLHERRLPYISVLTNPTTGGVTASFATLGDIILAEPDALIGFAGPRVIEQTIGEKLPKRAQKSEFLLEKGMLDRVVKRQDLKKQIAFFIEFLTNNKREEPNKPVTAAQKLKKLLKGPQKIEIDK